MMLRRRRVGGSHQHPPLSLLSFSSLLLLLLATPPSRSSTPPPTKKRTPKILTIGSVNADTFLPISRLPHPGENLTTKSPPTIDVPGGKGCNQAIAASKLGCTSYFCGRWGDDAAGDVLRGALEEDRVDLRYCDTVRNCDSGRGFVFLTDDGGVVGAVVAPGANFEWGDEDDDSISSPLSEDNFDAIMLQREIPEWVNVAFATAARRRNVTVFHDVGGEERDMSRDLLRCVDFLMPNESELKRLVGGDDSDDDDDDAIIDRMTSLQQRGASHVLCTLGSRGCLLLTSDGTILSQPACTLPPGCEVVDETGAGDCFRAAFVVAYVEGRPLDECLKWASCAGCLAVTKRGAVPSVPTREEVEELYQREFVTSLRGGGSIEEDDDVPFLFGSRLNSMKDRPDLTDYPNDVKGWIARQGTITGLDLVDFNYPQHFETISVAEAKRALDDAGLKAGAICLRYPHYKFQQGAMTHYDAEIRKEAIRLTMEAAKVAKELGCDEVVVWSAYDGYDYPFQVDYEEKWGFIVEAFRECCDAFPDVKFSLEFKPTDENTRFFTIPSTAAALLLVHQIDRPNMGLTLDFGHCLMSGENPAQSISLVGSKLFGLQLNDGYTRLAAEDGLMFASVHPGLALEAIYYLRKVGYEGHVYFDTFPQRTDPVREAEWNIKRVTEFWRASGKMDALGLRRILDRHDALGALKMIDDVLKR